jgi:transcriptional regulator with XRE-family HTH domain
MEVGSRLGVTQAEVSRLERREDIRISKLLQYVDALGGELEIRAKLPGGAAVLTQFNVAIDIELLDC